MQKVFEKIMERLEELKQREKNRPDDCDENGYGDGEQIYEDGRSQGRYEQTVKIIEIIQQAAEEYNNGWIPCSERLPEDKQTCLVTARIYFTPDHVDEIDNYIGVGIDTYSKQFGWLGTEPIAWQPLPAPYQPKGE